MKKAKYIRLLLLSALLPLEALLFSCGGVQEKYAYVADAKRNEALPIINNYSSLISRGDRLFVHVASVTPESTVPFNEETKHRVRMPLSRAIIGTTDAEGYLVGPDGNIVFPPIGKIKAEGRTLDEISRDIEGRLYEENYVKDPFVTITMADFHVTVIGEVQTPQMLNVQGNRLTIFEAIAICGDITMDGLRDRVHIIRFDEDEPIISVIDLTSASCLDSPYYYLQQNDIVYVEPTERKKRLASRNEEWPTYVGMGANSLRMAYLLVYRLMRAKDLQ